MLPALARCAIFGPPEYRDTINKGEKRSIVDCKPGSGKFDGQLIEQRPEYRAFLGALEITLGLEYGIAMISPSVVNQDAVDVATAVQQLTAQYFAHVAAMHVARDKRAEGFAPPIEPGQIVPVLRVPRRDGNAMVMWFNHYLALNAEPQTMDEFDRIWLRGALVTAGDLLGKHGYFGHEPEAEIIRHLRNGIAHGNRFSFHPSVIDKQSGTLKHPANIFRYSDRQKMPRHTVETHLDGSEVLWSWGGPDAVIDCLTVVGVHLWNVGYGLAIPQS